MSTTEPQRILKANAIRGLGSKVAFNYEDVRRRCEEHIETVRQQTRQMLQEAQAEAEQIRERAFAEARQRGRSEGLRDADSEIRRRAEELAERICNEKLNTVLPALRSAAETLAHERDRWLAAWESAAIELSIGIAEKVLRRELQARPGSVMEIVRHTLEMAAGSAEVRVRLHPDDCTLLAETADDIVRHMASCGEVAIVPDSTMTRGGCVVETRHGSIDARLETQLERIADELLQRR